MSDETSKAEQLLMWGLFAAGGARLLKDIVPKPAGGAHNALARRGFLDNAKHGQTRRLELTDKGWRWITDSEPFPIGAGETRVTAERRLLQSLTRSIKRNAASQGMELSNLFRVEVPAAAEAVETERKTKRASRAKTPKIPAAEAPAADAAAKYDIAAEIRDACRNLAGHPQRDGVRLSALRNKLGHVARADLDAALLAMREAGQANLMNLDNPRDIAAEKGAELQAGSQLFHVIWIEA